MFGDGLDITGTIENASGGKRKTYYANCSTLVFKARKPIQVVMKQI
jgi:hypothetical protein